MANPNHDAEQIDRIRRIGSTMRKAAPICDCPSNVIPSGAPLTKNPIKGGTPSGAKKGK